MEKRLVIRFFYNKYVLCTGEPAAGIEKEEGELYAGEIVSWHDSHENAVAARELIEKVYRPIEKRERDCIC